MEHEKEFIGDPEEQKQVDLSLKSGQSKTRQYKKCLLPFLLFSAKEQNYILFPLFFFDTRITSRTVK
jgi:hypothetical protein